MRLQYMGGNSIDSSEGFIALVIAHISLDNFSFTYRTLYVVVSYEAWNVKYFVHKIHLETC